VKNTIHRVDNKRSKKESRVVCKCGWKSEVCKYKFEPLFYFERHWRDANIDRWCDEVIKAFINNSSILDSDGRLKVKLSI
jgi:hypothetical protein